MKSTTISPTPSAGIMAQLKAGTAALHAVAESKPLEAALISGAIGQEQYKKYLSQRWLIHRDLETATDRAITRDPRLASLALPSLYQTKNLESDLSLLQTPLYTIQPMQGATTLLQEIKNAPSPAALMGIYYVFEGSKNGARYIARALAKAWSKTDTTTMRYLDPHGEEQRSLWQKFKTEMDALTWSPSEQEQMVKSAQTTFTAISALDDEIHAA